MSGKLELRCLTCFAHLEKDGECPVCNLRANELKRRAQIEAKAALFDEMREALDRLVRAADTAELFVIKAECPAEAKFLRDNVTQAIGVLAKANKIAELK